MQACLLLSCLSSAIFSLLLNLMRCRSRLHLQRFSIFVVDNSLYPMEISNLRISFRPFFANCKCVYLCLYIYKKIPERLGRTKQHKESNFSRGSTEGEYLSTSEAPLFASFNLLGLLNGFMTDFSMPPTKITLVLIRIKIAI